MHANHWYYRFVLIVGLLAAGPVCSAMTAQEYFEDARALIDQGKYSAAVIQLKNTLLLEPDNARARLLLGEAHLENGDAASAEKEISRARELGMDALEWKVPLGKTYLLLGRNDALLKEVTPEEVYPVAVRADILQLQGQARLGKQQLGEAEEKFLAAGRFAQQCGRSTGCNQRLPVGTGH
jgi:tetratricopeptide (TPR) repeat protein